MHSTHQQASSTDALIQVDLNESTLHKIEVYWKRRFFYYVKLCLNPSYETAPHLNLAFNFTEIIKNKNSKSPKKFNSSQEAFEFLGSIQFNQFNILKQKEIAAFFEDFSGLTDFIKENISLADQAKYYAAYHYAMDQTLTEKNENGWNHGNLSNNASRATSRYSTYSQNILRVQQNVEKAARQFIIEHLQNAISPNILKRLEDYLDRSIFVSGNKFTKTVASPNAENKRGSYEIERIVPRNVKNIYEKIELAKKNQLSSHAVICQATVTFLTTAANTNCFDNLKRSQSNKQFYADTAENLEDIFQIDAKATCAMMLKFMNETFPKLKTKGWSLFSASRPYNVSIIEKKLQKGKYKKALILADQYSNRCCLNPQEKRFYQQLRYRMMFKQDILNPLNLTLPKIDVSLGTPAARSTAPLTPDSQLIKGVEELKRQYPRGFGDTLNVYYDGSPSESYSHEEYLIDDSYDSDEGSQELFSMEGSPEVRRSTPFLRTTTPRPGYWDNGYHSESTDSERETTPLLGIKKRRFTRTPETPMTKLDPETPETPTNRGFKSKK